VFEIVISSRNKEKKRELKALLKGLGIKVIDLNDFPGAPKVKETGKTFEANAKLKALKIAKYTKRPAVADDSGLVVNALGESRVSAPRGSRGITLPTKIITVNC